jgi:hypothetical protein
MCIIRLMGFRSVAFISNIYDLVKKDIKITWIGYPSSHPARIMIHYLLFLYLFYQEVPEEFVTLKSIFSLYLLSGHPFYSHK